jgi:uncharacterized membrane protein YtjA (UPF0391 family)
MRGALLFLVMSIGVAIVGLLGVPARMQAPTQFAFFAFLVAFVVLMVRHLARSR